MFYVKTKRPSKQICELAKGNKLIRFKIIGGDLIIDYKSYMASWHAIFKHEVTNVKWIFDFEKMHEDGPYPMKELNFLIAGTKYVECHHQKA